jgi:SAM-dependent methyltransferase
MRLMAEAPDWLATLPPRLHEPLGRAAAGVPANVALMHILMQCPAPGDAETAATEAMQRLREGGQSEAADRLAAILQLLRANPQAYGIVHRILGGLDHERDRDEDAVEYWTAAFDQAARTHPEGSVALYALGSAELLEAATGEIVARLRDWGLLSPDTDCLDIGCGIGRIEIALAAHVRSVVGIDVAPAMVAEARRRSADLPNVAIHQSSGRDLAGFADASFDLALAVDSFPYVVQAGTELAQAVIREAARVLRPGGRLVILNFSYRGDLDLDRADLRSFAAGAGLQVVRNGTAEFTLWDAAAFVLAKALAAVAYEPASIGYGRNGPAADV